MLRRVMRLLARVMPGSGDAEENPAAVRAFGRLVRARDLLAAGPLRPGTGPA